MLGDNRLKIAFHIDVLTLVMFYNGLRQVVGHMFLVGRLVPFINRISEDIQSDLLTFLTGQELHNTPRQIRVLCGFGDDPGVYEHLHHQRGAGKSRSLCI